MELKEFNIYKKIKNRVYILYADGKLVGIFTRKQEVLWKMKKLEKDTGIVWCGVHLYEWDKIKNCYIVSDRMI